MQSKKTILITGGNSGIGKQTAITFAKNGFKVIITSRNDNSGKAAMEEIISISGNSDIFYIVGDLSSINGCRMLAKKIEDLVPIIDVLVNNAGTSAVEKKINQDGFEMTFMVNAIAPYILTRLLTPLLKKSKSPKVLNVSTGTSFLKMAKFNVEKSPYGLDYKKGATYASSKVAAAMLALNLAEELKAENIAVNSFSPGVFKTKSSMQDMKNFLLNLIRNILMLKSMPIEVAGDAPYYLATSANLEGITGSYFDMQQKTELPSNVTDIEKRRLLKEKIIEWKL